MRETKRTLRILLMISLLLVAIAPAALAFSDVEKNPYAKEIKELQEAKILNGSADGMFYPERELTNAEAVTLLVRGFDLNLAAFRFIKEPLASDYFDRVGDKSWYSEAFIVASLNGISLPKDIQPLSTVDGQTFATYLVEAAAKNNKDITAAMKSVEVTKGAITRGAAAGLLHKAIEAAKQAPEPITLPELKLDLTVEKVTDAVNKVVIKTQVPHPGYGLRITSIQFEGEQAIIHTEVLPPDPEKMYPQVITDVTVETYIASSYKPVLAK